jgi:hypothetical protein
MKKTDLATIILVASIGMFIAYLVGTALFGGFYEGTATIKTVDSISSEVEQPDERIFNERAINPAVPVEIVDTPNDLGEAGIGEG